MTFTLLEWKYKEVQGSVLEDSPSTSLPLRHQENTIKGTSRIDGQDRPIQASFLRGSGFTDTAFVICLRSQIFGHSFTCSGVFADTASMQPESSFFVIRSSF